MGLDKNIGLGFKAFVLQRGEDCHVPCVTGSVGGGAGGVVPQMPKCCLFNVAHASRVNDKCACVAPPLSKLRLGHQITRFLRRV